MIKSAINTSTNMVLVFDEYGEQVPEYQGQYQEVKERVLKDAPLGAIFGRWLDYEDDIQTVSREEW